MRLLTHNSLKFGREGFPLRISQVTRVRVDEPTTTDDTQVEFVKGLLPSLHWDALVQVREAVDESC